MATMTAAPMQATCTGGHITPEQLTELTAVFFHRRGANVYTMPPKLWKLCFAEMQRAVQLAGIQITKPARS